jgi:hypothetical protein
MTRGRIAWAIAGLDVAAMLFVGLVAPAFDVVGTVLYMVGIASFAGVGALLLNRVPGNPIGVLLLAAGSVLVTALLIGTYADYGAAQRPPLPAAGLARLVGNTMFVYPFAIAVIGVPLVFPTGRLPSARYRWVVRLAIADMVAWTIVGMLGSSGGDTAAATAGLDVPAPLVAALNAFVLVATLVSFVAAIVAIWDRFRHGNPVQRQQVKWLVAVVGVAGTVLPISLVFNNAIPQAADALSSIAILAMFSLPIVIGIAILRYRLFEIDRIISRTVSYGAVTGILAVVFVGTILVSQTVLASFFSGSSVAVAVSTLVVAALFQPLRRRVQSAVDARFNRSRYDAERTVAAFAGRLRDQVDLTALEADALETVVNTLRPSTVGLWLRREQESAR